VFTLMLLYSKLISITEGSHRSVSGMSLIVLCDTSTDFKLEGELSTQAFITNKPMNTDLVSFATSRGSSESLFQEAFKCSKLVRSPSSLVIITLRGGTNITISMCLTSVIRRVGYEKH